MPLSYLLQYAGVPFVADIAQCVKMPFRKGGIEPSPASQEPPQDQQPLADLIDEINRLIDTRVIRDFSFTAERTNHDIDAIARYWPKGVNEIDPVRIGEWFYPCGATRWSVFRGLATSSQVAAMLAGTQSVQLTLQGVESGVAFVQAQPTQNVKLSTQPQITTLNAVANTAANNSNQPNYPTDGNINTTLGGTLTSVNTSQITGLIQTNTVAIPNNLITTQAGYAVFSGPNLFVMQSSPIAPDNPSGNPSLYTLASMLYMLPARPLAEHGAGYDGLYLVTLVDERYYWQYVPISLQIGQSTTWDDLITQLANALGIMVYYEPISSVYGQPEPDSQLWCSTQNAGVLLSAVAANVGRMVVRNLNGTYTLQSPDDSEAIVEENRGPANEVVRLAGGDMFYPGDGNLNVGDLTPQANFVLPSIITTSFPLYVYGDDPVPHFLNTRYVNQRPSAWYEQGAVGNYAVQVSLEDAGVDFAELGLGGTAGTEHFIHSTVKALISNEDQITVGGSPDNLDGLTALAQQIASDYCAWQIGSALDEIYPGTYAWTPEGYHDIIWTYSERKRQASCRVMRTQWNMVVQEMQHATPPILLQGTTIPVMTNTPRGIGGPSVALTVQDSQGMEDDTGTLMAGGTFDPSTTDSSITTTLAAELGPTDTTAYFDSVDFFPTQNFWKGVLGGSETALFAGTSGGISVSEGMNGGYQVDIITRAIDGTLPATHSLGTSVYQAAPNTNYGTNRIVWEKGQKVYPSDWTSGGIQSVAIVPQTQTVRIWSNQEWSGGGYVSGSVMLFDSTQDDYITKENIWVAERNDQTFASGDINKNYEGQFTGYSQGVPSAPIYLVNRIPLTSGMSGGSTGGPTTNQQNCIVVTPNNLSPGNPPIDPNGVMMYSIPWSTLSQAPVMNVTLNAGSLPTYPVSVNSQPPQYLVGINSLGTPPQDVSLSNSNAPLVAPADGGTGTLTSTPTGTMTSIYNNSPNVGIMLSDQNSYGQLQTIPNPPTGQLSSIVIPPIYGQMTSCTSMPSPLPAGQVLTLQYGQTAQLYFNPCAGSFWTVVGTTAEPSNFTGNNGLTMTNFNGQCINFGYSTPGGGALNPNFGNMNIYQPATFWNLTNFVNSVNMQGSLALAGCLYGNVQFISSTDLTQASCALVYYYNGPQYVSSFKVSKPPQFPATFGAVPHTQIFGFVNVGTQSVWLLPGAIKCPGGWPVVLQPGGGLTLAVDADTGSTAILSMEAGGPTGIGASITYISFDSDLCELTTGCTPVCYVNGRVQGIGFPQTCTQIFNGDGVCCPDSCNQTISGSGGGNQYTCTTTTGGTFVSTSAVVGNGLGGVANAPLTLYPAILQAGPPYGSATDTTMTDGVNNFLQLTNLYWPVGGQFNLKYFFLLNCNTVSGNWEAVFELRIPNNGLGGNGPLVIISLPATVTGSVGSSVLSVQVDMTLIGQGTQNFILQYNP